MLVYRLYSLITIVLVIALPLYLEDGLVQVAIVVLLHFIISAIGAYKIQWNLYIKSINRFNTDKRQVVLSFDDGPVQQTEAILNLLKEYNAKASFFCIGEKLNSNAETVKRINTEGHTLGNHSLSHRTNFPLQAPKQIRAELNQTNEYLQEIAGEECKFFRPPFGVTNPLIYWGTKGLKLQSIGWSIRSLDTSSRSKEQILKRITSRLHKGAIILLHDHTKDVCWILKELLEFLRQNDYEIVNLKDIVKE